MLLALISLVSCEKKSESSSFEKEMGNIVDTDFDGLNDFVEKDNGLNPYIVNLPIRSFELTKQNLIIDNRNFKLQSDDTKSKWTLNKKNELVFNIGCLPLDAHFFVKKDMMAEFHFEIKEKVNFNRNEVKNLNFELWLDDYRVQKNELNVLDIKLRERCLKLKVAELSYVYKNQIVNLSSSLKKMGEELIKINIETSSLAKEYLVSSSYSDNLIDFFSKEGIDFKRSGVRLIALNNLNKRFSINNSGRRFWLSSLFNKGDRIFIKESKREELGLDLKMNKLLVVGNKFEFKTDREKSIIKINKKFYNIIALESFTFPIANML